MLAEADELGLSEAEGLLLADGEREADGETPGMLLFISIATPTKRSLAADTEMSTPVSLPRLYS